MKVWTAAIGIFHSLCLYLCLSSHYDYVPQIGTKSNCKKRAKAYPHVHYIHEMLCGKTKSWENAQTIKVHFPYFLFVTCFYNTKSATIFHFYNKYIYMCIYLYISIYKQFLMHANATEASTCPNNAISSKDNKGQYNPTLIKLDCHTLT